MPVIASRLGSAPSSTVALVGAGDPAASRLVYSMVIGLVVIGVLLIVLGIWIVRQTRVDLDVLAPLERMGDGEWKKRDRATQRRMLDEVRPDGARPLAPATRPPSLDDEFELEEHPVTSFSDLGPGVPSEERDPTPVGNDADEPAIGPLLVPVIEVDDEVLVQPETDAETEPQTDAGTEPEPETDAGTEPEPEIDAETEPDPEIDAGTEPEPEIDAETEPEPEPEPAPDSRS